MLERRILELESECEELRRRERSNEEQFRRELEQWSLKARTALEAAQTGRITAKEREEGLKRKIKESERELSEMKLEIEQLKRAQNRYQVDPEYELEQQRNEAKIKMLEEKVKNYDEHMRQQEIRLKGCEMSLAEERMRVTKEKESKEAAESALKQKDNQITKMQKIIEDSMNRERISDLKRRDLELDRRKVETEKEQAIRKREELQRQREIAEEEKEQEKDEKNEIKEMYNDVIKRYQLLKESHTALEAQILDQSSQIQQLSKQLAENAAKPLQAIHSDTQHILKDTDKIIQQQAQQHIKDASLVPKIDHVQLQNSLEARMEELVFSRKECATLKDQQADLKTQLWSLRLEFEKLKKRNVVENQIDTEQNLQMKTANELAMQAIIAERIAQIQSKCDVKLNKYKRDFDGIVKLCSTLKEKNGEMESEIASLNKHIAAQNAFIMNQQIENQELWDKINAIHPANKRILINQQTQHHLSDIANRQYKLQKQMKMIPSRDQGVKEDNQEGFGDIRAAEITFKKKVIDLCDHISPESHQFIHADTQHYY